MFLAIASHKSPSFKGQGHLFFFFFLTDLFIFIYLFLAALGLHCCAWAFSSCGERGPPPHCGARAPHCGGFSCCGAQAPGARASVVVARGLQSTGSVVVAHKPSCSAACGILPDQGPNPHPPHWQADSPPLRHQGSPQGHLLMGDAARSCCK